MSTGRLGPHSILERNDEIYVRNDSPPTPVAQAASLVTPSSFYANCTVPGYFNFLVLRVCSDPTMLVPIVGYEAKVVANLSEPVTGLVDNAVYYYTFRAATGEGTGAASNVIMVTTLDADTTGYNFPGIVQEYASIGDFNNLNGATKVSVMLFFKVTPVLLQDMTLFARWAELTGGDSRDQFLTGLGNNALTPKLLFGMWGAGARAIALGSTNLIGGKRYKVTFVFDGALVGNAARAKIYLASYTAGDAAYTVDALENLAFSGAAVPASLSTPAAVETRFGNARNGTSSPFKGQMLSARVWIGTALSAGQVAAEAELTNVVPPSLRYDMDGNFNNTGSIVGFNGAPTANVLPVTVSL